MSLGFGTRAAVLVVVGCLLGSCNTAATQGTSVAAGSESTANAALARKLRVSCKDAAAGEGCIQGNLDVGDYYDIVLSSNCSANSPLGGVIGAKSKLLDVLPFTGSNAKIIAFLTTGQLVCVQAIARAGKSPPLYYYVAAVSRENTACRDRKFCLRFGTRSISYLTRRSLNRGCSASVNNNFIDDCAHGWIDSDSLEVSFEH